MTSSSRAESPSSGFPKLPVVSAGIDWISSTTRSADRSNVLYGMAKRWQSERSRSGYVTRPWGGNGFLGDTVDGVTVGTRTDECFLRLSGECARLHGPSVFPWIDHLSRIDYQVTLRDDDHERDWCDLVRLAIQSDGRVQKGFTTTREIRSWPAGHTFYIGSRTSDRFFRVYDKSAESAEMYPLRCWRFEIEYKGKRAESEHERWCHITHDARYTIQKCANAYRDYHFVLPTDGITQHWRDSSPAGPTDDQRYAEYLEGGIRSVVRRGIETFGRERTMRMIGLMEDVNEA